MILLEYQLTLMYFIHSSNLFEPSHVKIACIFLQIQPLEPDSLKS